MRVSVEAIRPDSRRNSRSKSLREFSGAAILHVQLHDRPDLDLTAPFQDRTTFREFTSLVQTTGPYDGEAAYDVFGFRKGAVGDGFLRALHDFAARLQRLTALDNMAAF